MKYYMFRIRDTIKVIESDCEYGPEINLTPSPSTYDISGLVDNYELNDGMFQMLFPDIKTEVVHRHLYYLKNKETLSAVYVYSRADISITNWECAV